MNIPSKFQSIAHPTAIVSGPNVRFSILTSRLIRLEYSPEGKFENQASQVFWQRMLPVPSFITSRSADQIDIVTEHLSLCYRSNPGGFTPDSLSIKLKKDGATWCFGDPNPDNLLGTTRTLDETHGAIHLEPGLISRSGWAVVDDSHSLVFKDDGWLEPRSRAGNLDLYFFGYGQDYAQCLQDYTKISSTIPLIPRFILGNWWSRYWSYSQQELTQLMEDFRNHEVPLSVCIVDMDWHLTDAPTGWTGYTWNRELFPDPQGFITWLHAQGLKTALNLHPANGIHPHEEKYAEMATSLGVDPASQDPIPFDIANPQFANSYFNILHHPKEEQGVDFWWMDWQQERITRITGLDPLWWLNHLHYYDLGRNGVKRPFVFSRWGGLGNHRYPIGFSGDTEVSWASLSFQPYFTATAANVGFGWWSHDIGGHHRGIEDPELYVRWVQFGVFSPIFRLHCTKNVYQDRCPWSKDAETFRITRDYMQLRHAFIPYIYSMAWRAHDKGVSLITPMYYDHPSQEEAYSHPNQYNFGSELIVAPYTTPRDPHTNLTRQNVWLPEGNWFNFFTGELIPGGKLHTTYGTLEEIPVFAHAGAIIPLAKHLEWSETGAPKHLDVHIFPGESRGFSLYEDDGETLAYENGVYAITQLSQEWSDNQVEFIIQEVKDHKEIIPSGRTYTLSFEAINQPDQMEILIDGQVISAHAEYDTARRALTIDNILLPPESQLVVRLTISVGKLISDHKRIKENIQKHLHAFRLETSTKWMLDLILDDLIDNPDMLLTYPALQDSQRIALISTIRQ